MSEFDALHHDSQDLDLDHGHSEFGNNDDHFSNHDAFGNEHHQALDEHFAQGHNLEADTPTSHFAEQDFTNADVHASEDDASFGEHDASGDHSDSFGDLDRLQEHFDSDSLSAHHFEGPGGGFSVASN